MSQAKARAAHEANARAAAALSSGGTCSSPTHELTGVGAGSSSTHSVKDEDPALNSRGEGIDAGSPALNRSGPREEDYPKLSLGGTVVPPQGALTVTALSTGRSTSVFNPLAGS